jgi:hypothetical protein
MSSAITDMALLKTQNLLSWAKNLSEEANRSRGSDLLRRWRRLRRGPIRIDCEPLRSSGRYRLAGLIERFGADAAGPDVLMELGACERRKDFSQPCGARFTDLAQGR